MLQRIFIAIALSVFSVTALAAPPDLRTLTESGFIMGPGSAAYPVHAGWVPLSQVMKTVDIFDPIVTRIEEIVCGNSTNKSVLLVGESSLAYQYVFARLANRPNSKCPAGMWHVDINVSKIESGHKYVGEVDEYWQQKILAPSNSKDVVMYLQSVGSLIGIGSHSHDDTGIEREYVANFTSGRMRTVGYSDKYEYNDVVRSKNGYVMESFADKIILPPVDAAQTKILVQAYLAALYPNLTLLEKDLNYLVTNSAFYQPNRQEPDRSISVLNQMIRQVPNSGGGGQPIEFREVVESKHPYDNSTSATFLINKPEVQQLQLNFSQFDVEDSYDFLKIYDGKTGVEIDSFTGNKGAFSTGYYSTNSLKLVLQADSSGNKQGFKITSINGLASAPMPPYQFKREDVRRAVMTVAQVPQWIMDRDYAVIKQLPAKLDGDVVGVAEGKKDLVRLAKNGYVAGRTDEKPVGTILFTGPTGTGKSYIAKKMAEFMGMRLITMDMTSYKEPSSFKLFQETLANHLTNTPYAMYFFEEIDKASIEVLDQLYFMMDEGVFYDNRQRPLFARGAFIMMTTNAASDTILKNPNAPNLRELVMDDLQKSFRMSFLNRFDAISIFKPFTDAEFVQRARTLLDKKVAKLKDTFDWASSLDQGIYDYVSRFGRSAEFGARPMERLVENVLGTGIAEYQLNQGVLEEDSHLQFTKLNPVHDFRLSVQGGKSQNYTVDPSNNSLYRAATVKESLRRLQKFFEKNRDY